MKKATIMLCVIGLLLTILPMKASAADYSNSFNFGKYGQIKVEWEYTDTTNGIKEWKFYLTPSSAKKTIYLKLTPSNVEIQSITANESAIQIIDKSTESTGITDILAMATNPNGLSSGKEVLLFTVQTKDVDKANCRLDPSPLYPECSNINGNYFDKDGNSVSKDEYDKVCSNTTPLDPDKPNNPPTGSVIPYVAVAGGILAIAGVYLFSRKSNKMYKI